MERKTRGRYVVELEGNRMIYERKYDESDQDDTDSSDDESEPSTGEFLHFIGFSYVFSENQNSCDRLQFKRRNVCCHIIFYFIAHKKVNFKVLKHLFIIFR